MSEFLFVLCLDHNFFGVITFDEFERNYLCPSNRSLQHQGSLYRVFYCLSIPDKVYWTVSSIPVLWVYGIDYLEFSQKKLIEKSLIIGEKDFVGSRYEVWRLIN